MKKLNPYVLTVMRWLDDKDSVSQDELVKNRNAAAAADADAEKWIAKYFKRTGDNRAEYEAEVRRLLNLGSVEGMLQAGKATAKVDWFDYDKGKQVLPVPVNGYSEWSLKASKLLDKHNISGKDFWDGLHDLLKSGELESPRGEK